MTSDQEAVCGTCGGSGKIAMMRPDGSFYSETCYGCAGNGAGRIPTPVVPSNDEIPPLGEPDYSVLCTECGAPMALPNGLHHPLRERFAQFHEPCDRCRDHYFGMPRLSAPPTPSQDAEGDRRATRVRGANGIARTTLWRYPIRKTWHEVEVPEAVESAIRAPYEALVKAARMLKQLHVPFDSEDGRTMERAEAWSALTAALTRIESLGGRKDG